MKTPMLLWHKIESLEIEARDSSVLTHKARQPWDGKGNTAEVGNLPEGFPAGSSENICRTVTK